jgi:hypothetical protein
MAPWNRRILNGRPPDEQVVVYPLPVPGRLAVTDLGSVLGQSDHSGTSSSLRIDLVPLPSQPMTAPLPPNDRLFPERPSARRASRGVSASGTRPLGRYRSWQRTWPAVYALAFRYLSDHSGTSSSLRIDLVPLPSQPMTAPLPPNSVAFELVKVGQEDDERFRPVAGIERSVVVRIVEENSNATEASAACRTTTRKSTRSRSGTSPTTPAPRAASKSGKRTTSDSVPLRVSSGPSSSES